MATLLMMRGLPASGKSTYAKNLVENSEGKWVRVNRDDLRSMMLAGKWSKGREKTVVKAQEAILKSLMTLGTNIVIDDTNIDRSNYDRFLEVIDTHNSYNDTFYKLEVKYMDTSLDECLERNSKREDPVPEKFIRMQHNQLMDNG